MSSGEHQQVAAMSASEGPESLRIPHANEGLTSETETTTCDTPSAAHLKQSDRDYEELRVNDPPEIFDPTIRSAPSPAVLQPSPIRSKPLQLASSDDLEAAPLLDALPTVNSDTHDETSAVHRTSVAPTNPPYASPAAAREPSLTPSGPPATHSHPNTVASPPMLEPSSPRTRILKVSSPHALLSLDAVWREPLILPPLRDRRNSTISRDRPSERPNARVATAEDRGGPFDRRNSTAASHSHRDPHVNAGAGLFTTGSAAQSTDREARTLQDSSKANTVQEGKDTSLGPKSSAPVLLPGKQDHRPVSQTPSTPKSSRAALPRDTGAESAPLAPFSLWEYLKEEVLATDVDSTQEMRWDRVSNFMAVPWQCEKMILFGFVICLDSFLYTFTILPLRFAVAATLWCRNLLHNVTSPSSTPHVSLHSSHKCDIIKTALIVVSCYILSQVTDASKMYHSVRGQDTIKLYVIFNVLEIVDRLCCSLGQDLLDALFSRRTLGRQSDGRQPFIRPLHLFVLALIYIQIHTIVLFYQLVTLNVAINSYDNALLTLLLSNQFVEIKGSVFKKFEKENLFQMTCADIVERFQLTLILFAIGVRNLIEVTSGGDNLGSAASRPRGGPLGDVPLPRSFTVLPSLSVLATSFAPVVIVLGSECVVDWLKHAFITKFNHIRPSVYGRFMDVLCRDLVIAGPAQPVPLQGQSKARNGDADKESGGPGLVMQAKRRNTFVDQSPILSRRLGFAALPLACLLARVSVQIYGMLGDDSHYDECAIPASVDQEGKPGPYKYVSSLISNALRGKISVLSFSPSTSVQALALLLPVVLCWVFLIALKVLLGTALISFAHHRYSSMSAREVEEELNDRTRPHIGVNSLEAAYEDKVKQVLSGADGAKAGGKPKYVPGPGSNLLDVNRYTMVKSRLY